MAFRNLMQPTSNRIANAKRVANPGCWPQGLIALVKPLIAAGLLSKDTALTYGGVSGYSGGGKKMIEDYEAKGDAASQLCALWSELQSQAFAGDEALYRILHPMCCFSLLLAILPKAC